MNQDILDFFIKLSQNSLLRKKFENKSLDECYELAIKNSKGKFTKEELVRFVENFYSQENKLYNSKKKDIVNEENLRHVAGGGDILKNISDIAMDDLETILLDVRTDEDKVNLFGAANDLFAGASNFGIAVATLASKMKDDANLSGLENLQEKRKRLEQLYAMKSPHST